MWMEVEACGDSWKVVKSVLIFVYTLVISLSLASKPSTQRIELSYSLLLSSLPLLSFWCYICSYFADCVGILVQWGLALPRIL